MSKRFDICVIGAGPAGMVAASMAAEFGLSTVLIDDRPSPGGQIYRGLEDGPFRNSAALGKDYSDGLEILERFRRSDVTAIFGANLWRVDMDKTGGVTSLIKDHLPSRIRFKKLILATGAMERPVPFDGWTLPGIMGVGAAQLLLKSSAIGPTGKVVLAGNGPLTLLFATQLLGQGIGISAFLDTAPKLNDLSVTLRHLPAVIGNRDKIWKGLRMLRTIRSANIPVFRNVSHLVARGSGQLEAITFESEGQRRNMDTDVLLVHEGIIPNTQLSRALGLKHIWDDHQRCLRPEIDSFGESSISGVFVIGDAAAINGALAAPASAKVAIGRILEQTGRKPADTRQIVLRAAATLSRERMFRPFLDKLYSPRISVEALTDTTIVCRCEEVTAGTIRQAIADGAVGPAQAKAFTRCGMGTCQGRMCGPIVSQLIAKATGRTAGDVAPYNVRFPLKPLTVGEMAASCPDEEQRDNCNAA